MIAELPEGYTIEFLFNLDVDANALERTTGKVDASLTGTFNVEEFKYAVKVTPAEGDAITSEWTTVKVVDANKPVEVTEYGLDFDLDYITMTDAGVEIKATKALNGLGKEVTAPAVEKVTSSDITTAYYDDGIVPLKAGTVTFTVKFEDIEETYPLTVEIKEAQKPSAIKADDVIVKFGDSYTMEVELLDQYGELFRGTKDDAEGLVIHLLSDDKVINKEFGFEKPTGEGWPDDHPTLELNNGIISTSAPMSIDFEGAPITATLKLGDKVLGSFKIEIVKIEEDTKPDQYKLTFNDPKKTELDVNPIDNEALKELKIDVEAYVKGARVDTPSTGLIAKTSNKKVVDFKSEYSGGNTITVEAVAEGTATITLYTKEGDLETKVADIEVVVKNTTPQIDTLTVKPVAGENKGKLVVVEGADVNVNAIAGQLTTGDAELDTKLATDIIDADSFVYSEADGKLIVTLKDEFGGKSFVFDIVITPAGEGA